jgi:NAD(P)-dependent dehydrogenase (short-subunit alcohol dehydrogenase family)
MARTSKTHSVPDPLKNKVTVITGASRGIGFAIAEALAAVGSNLVITSRKSADAEAAAEKLAVHGVRVLPIQCDVRDEDAIERMFEGVRSDFGSVDILVNNAGHSQALVPIEKTPTDLWQDTLATNLTGTFLCTRAALPLMKQGSTIVNNISTAAYKAFPNFAAYNVSKAGALAFTNTLREELRERGIRVMALVPGATDTDIWQQFWPDAPREKMVSAKDVAAVLIAALRVSPVGAVDELKIGPTVGVL